MTKVFVATPAYDGKVNVQYAISLSETVNLLANNNIEVVLRINTTGSLLCAERNRLTEAFWESDCTHMLCIDSDLGWPAQAVIEMLKKDMDFVGGCYPSRKENAFLFRPELNPDASIVCDKEKQLLKMQYIPAGFMLIKRDVIRYMRQFHPELYFEPKHKEAHGSSGFCFFQTELFDGEFWGEDYVFCRRVREASFDIWVDPLIEFDHCGRRGMLMDALTQDKDKALKI